MNQETEPRPLMVSIRCITYNHEPYIRQCLDGFVMQKTNFRFEAIVHDDASTDGTADIIREYAEKYPDIIKPIFESENQYSKHDGSIGRIMDEACTGKYIAICEGDDYWIDSQKLQIQVDFMESHPDYSLCGTNGLVLWDYGEHEPRYFNRIFESKELLDKDIIGKWFLPTASLFFRKSVRDNYPNWANKFYSGDLTLALVALNKGRIYSFGDITCVYRKTSLNPDSVSNTCSELYGREQQILIYNHFNEWTDYKYESLIKQALNEINDHIKKLKLYDEYVKLRDLNIFLPFLKMPLYSLKLLKYSIAVKIRQNLS